MSNMSLSCSEEELEPSDKDSDSLGVNFEEESTAGGSTQSENAEQRNLEDQTRKTSVLRCLVITTLLTACALVANAALIVALNKQEEGFKDEYARLSERLVDRFFTAIGQTVATADSLASQTALDLEEGPNKSIPNFEAQADGFRRLSSSTLITYSPILKGSEQRSSWEEYAVNNFDAAARSEFESDYSPFNGRYDEVPLVTFRGTGDRTVQDGIHIFENGEAVDDATSQSSDYSIPIWQVRTSTRRIESRCFGFVLLIPILHPTSNLRYHPLMRKRNPL
jgi:hypothetical protein